MTNKEIGRMHYLLNKSLSQQEHIELNDLIRKDFDARFLKNHERAIDHHFLTLLKCEEIINDK